MAYTAGERIFPTREEAERFASERGLPVSRVDLEESDIRFGEIFVRLQSENVMTVFVCAKSFPAVIFWLDFAATDDGVVPSGSIVCNKENWLSGFSDIEHSTILAAVRHAAVKYFFTSGRDGAHPI